ncbi:MAG: glucodextranase DOMON-like domain-containing protein, partial [Bacteroidota bacterium]
DEENFHPYHQFEPYYPKDAAYHNGTVWTWLQGQVISELCRLWKEDLAARLTNNTVLQILDRGAVGTQSELLDAVPRPREKEPRLSGTFSQAWNLAEFIRNFYDDYLGAKVSKFRHTFVLHPSLPKFLGKVKARINLEGRAFDIEIDQRRNTKTISVKSPALRRSGAGIVVLPTTSGTKATISFDLLSNAHVRVVMRDTNISVSSDGVGHPFTSDFASIPSHGVLENLAFAEPRIKPGLKALRGPDYPLIPHSRLKSTNLSARIFIDAADPVGDDVGAGAYTYPNHPYFASGILDITRFTVSHDDSNAHFTLKFRALSNPGWHPEYGFQLTYVAIAIDENGVRSSGTRIVPHNSNYTVDEEHAYEKLILVGGGVRLEDSKGKILAAYIPTETDVKNPLGNTASGTISFAMPCSYLGKPDKNWTFTVLVGGQDDHGGSGLGEFRTVNKDAGEWNGGGKKRPDEPNVYDVLQATIK